MLISHTPPSRTPSFEPSDFRSHNRLQRQPFRFLAGILQAGVTLKDLRDILEISREDWDHRQVVRRGVILTTFMPGLSEERDRDAHLRLCANRYLSYKEAKMLLGS